MDWSQRLADAIAILGLAVAVVAVLDIGSGLFGEQILVWLQGPAPCGGGKGQYQPDTSCLLAHPDYYQYDPVFGSWSTPEMRINQALEPYVGPAIFPLALGAAVISGLALMLTTRLRRIAISALTVSSLILVGVAYVFLVLSSGGGD